MIVFRRNQRKRPWNLETQKIGSNWKPTWKPLSFLFHFYGFAVESTQRTSDSQLPLTSYNSKF